MEIVCIGLLYLLLQAGLIAIKLFAKTNIHWALVLLPTILAFLYFMVVLIFVVALAFTL